MMPLVLYVQPLKQANKVKDYLTLSDINLTNKTALLRADLNVPFKNGKVTNMARLERLVPTLDTLGKAGAKTVILSHFGRPDGKIDPQYSLQPIAAALSSILKKSVAFAHDCIGDDAKSAIAAMKAGDILVLENTRFHPEEEANDPAFAMQLAALGDLFVHDAFSAAHRAHASTAGIANYLPAVAGCLMQAELEALHNALSHPKKPVAALVGGSKISTKLDLLNNLVRKVDHLVLGGGMANTFLAAQGVDVGASLYEAHMLETARAISSTAKECGCVIHLPTDVVVAPRLEANVTTTTVAISHVPQDQMILDLGPAACKAICTTLDTCKTIVWNGPLGAFETKPFDDATNYVARHVAALTKAGKILSVAGGGDTVSAMAAAGIEQGLSYLSSAGGAFLEWLEGKDLPGVAALRPTAMKAQSGAA